MYKIPVGCAHRFAAVAVIMMACTVSCSNIRAEEKVAVWGPVDYSYPKRTLWLDPYNWAEGVAPGRHTVKDVEGNIVTNGTVGWTARFERSDANWLSEFNGSMVSISNVVFSGDNSTTRLGSGYYHTIPLEEGGGFYVEESCKKVPEVLGTIGIAGQKTATVRYPIRNDSLHGELQLMGGFYNFRMDGVFGSPHMQFQGKGIIRLGGTFPGNSGFRPYLDVAMDEGGLVKITNSVYNFRSLEIPANLPKQYIEIQPNSKLRTGVQDSVQQLNALSDLEISGEGTFLVNITTGHLNIGKGARVDIKSAIGQYSTQTEAAFTVKGEGVLSITGRNDIPQDLTVHKSTFEAFDIGNAGSAGNLGLGNSVRLADGAKLRYAGAGETADRSIRLINGIGCIEQAGTGTLEISGDVSAEKNGTTLLLCNDTAIPATLSGDIAAAYNPTMRKTGSGEWVLSGSNSSTGGCTLEGGVLTVASASALPSLSVKGAGVLKIAPGITADVALTYASGSLDVRLGEGASFKSSGMSGIAPDWLTVNGAKAKFASDGSLVSMEGNDVEIAARGGVIPHLPDSVVGIVRNGDSGSITLAQSETQVLALNQEAAVDAVVRFGQGEKLTVETIIVKTNAAPLVFGCSDGFGSVDAAGETMTFDTMDSNSVVSVRTAIALTPEKTLLKLGAGRLVLPDDFSWGGKLDIVEGMVTCTNTSGIVPSVRLYGSGTFEVAGDASRTFSQAQPDFSGRLAFAGGVNTVADATAIGVSQSHSAKITTSVQVKEGAEMHITDPDGLGGRILVAGGSGTDGSGAVKIMSKASDGSGKVYNGCAGIELTSDTLMVGGDGLNYFGIVRGSGFRRIIDMNGHRLTKTGPGRFLVAQGEVVDPGIFEFVGPSGMWMQEDFDLGPEDSPALVMRDGATFATEKIKPQRRPLCVKSGRLSLTAGQENRNRRDVDIWKGPISLEDVTSIMMFTLNGTNARTRFTLEGEISGPGSISVEYASHGLLEILNPDNSKWTGSLNVDGRRGGSALAAYAASIPAPNNVTCSYTRVIAPMPNWEREEILDYANNANLMRTGFISIDSSGLDDGSVFELSNADVTGDDFALAHDGANALHLKVTDEIEKPIGIGSFNGTLKVSAPGTLKLSRLVANSDSTNGCGKILLDGAGDVRLAGVSGSVVAGTAMHDHTKNDRGEIEIRNSTVRPAEDGASSPSVHIGRYGDGLLKLGEGAVVTARVDIVASGPGSNQGAIWQTGGEIWNGYEGMSAMDIAVNGAAYHEIRAGRAVYPRGPRFASGGSMLFAVHGGELSIGDSTIEDYPCFGGGGPFHMYVKGGTVNSYGRCYLPRQSSGHTASAILTIDGEDAVVDFNDNTVYMGGGQRNNVDGPAKAILNINAGFLKADSIGRYPSQIDDTVQRAYVNFNGGTYVLQGGTSFGVANGYPTVPNRITIFEGGAAIDTHGINNAHCTAPLCGPTGNSVVSVAIPAAIASREFISPPYIEIFDFDGDGDGASAYAELDTSTRRVSRIVVTSPGWDYTSAKAVFKLGKTVICTNDCAIAPVVGGGLTKTGAGTLLLSATNTYSGATVVKEGTLKLKFAESLPSNTVVYLEGGTLDLNGFNVPVAKVVGDGGDIVNGSVALEGIVYDVASEEHSTYGCPVTFAPDSVVKVVNADRLDKNRRYLIAQFEDGVENAPLSFEGLPEDVAGEWRIILSRGCLKLYRPRGSVISFR